ncbi:unnamed protein product [Prorocentrum cordatum]|uniref:Condensin complex subunit 2 n=1 Tax=Prorocentrum cordatum TaxID=2364126 RepID=A0ABN9UCN7_9DINO|nr:unnamed protein product [Polarella glacialis]
MTAQFCSMSSVSTSWKRKARRIKLAICRQAVFDVMQFNARDPYFVADPNTFPAFGWFDNLDDCARNPCPFQGNSEGQVSVLLSSLSVPTAGPTDRGEAFSSHSVAYSPDVVQSPDGGLQSRLGSVSFDPGVQNEELQDEGFQDEDLQSEGVLNDKLHYSQHAVFLGSSSEVCHAPFPDTLSASVDPGVREEDLHDEEARRSPTSLRNQTPSWLPPGRKDNCASSSRLCSDELQSNRSECQAARDSARANDDAVALWREFERLPKEEFWARIEALNAYKLRMGIESPEEAPSPEEDAGRGKGQRHRRNRRRARAKAQAVLTGSSMSKSAHQSTCDPPQPPSSFHDSVSSALPAPIVSLLPEGDKETEVDELHNYQSECDEDADSDAAFHAWDNMATQRVRADFYLKQAALHRFCEALRRRDGGGGGRGHPENLWAVSVGQDKDAPYCRVVLRTLAVLDILLEWCSTVDGTTLAEPH